ncbi:MAG: MarC family protein [Conexivisphaera sp.]
MSARERIIGRSRYMELIIFLAALIVIRVALTGLRVISGGIDPLEVAILSVQLFAVMDPISALPLYLYFEEGMEQKERTRLWTTVVAAMVVLLMFFTLVGGLLLQLFGVSIYSFMLGGGILLMVLAVDIMGEGSRSLSLDPQEAAVVPLASPLLVGPGTAATLIIMSDTRSMLDLLLAVVIVAVLTAIIMRFSRSIALLMGKNGIRALSRLLSIIIAGFAAQLIYQGLVGWGLIRPI